MNKSKCLEYYLDSRKYNYQEVQKSIDETKKEYVNKEVTVDININQYGMYVITFYFENKNNFFNKIKIFLKRKSKKILLLKEENQNKNNIIEKNNIKERKRLEKYSDTKYGEYKNTGTYKPY